MVYYTISHQWWPLRSLVFITRSPKDIYIVLDAPPPALKTLDNHTSLIIFHIDTLRVCFLLALHFLFLIGLFSKFSCCCVSGLLIRASAILLLFFWIKINIFEKNNGTQLSLGKLTDAYWNLIWFYGLQPFAFHHWTFELSGLRSQLVILRTDEETSSTNNNSLNPYSMLAGLFPSRSQ